MKLNFKNQVGIAALCMALAACATAPTSEMEAADAMAAAVKDDPRANLGMGLFDAENVNWNMERTESIKTPEGFFDPDAIWRLPGEGESFSPIVFANTDLAFDGDKVFMGSWHGFNVFDRNESGELETLVSVVCPGGQGDVSVHGNLLFMSTEENRARLDCTGAGVDEQVSAERFRGVRIFDISDMSAPRQVAAVQTCRGSHTHTVLPHPTDDNVVYIYNSATSGVRSGDELGICSTGSPEENPDTALYSIDVIKVSLDAPEDAAIVNRPRIFADKETGQINGLWMGGQLEEGAQRTAVTNHCHDINVYPEMNLAGGACSGNGILLDISDPENPQRISELSDPDMAYWHSAIFNNDATKLLFADEWGGGLGPKCRAEDPKNWGGDIIADITEDGLVKRSQYKIDTVQSDKENCVSHNGSIIPVPGRDIMVQSWYQGGISIIDFTNSANPVEIAYFDQGPIDDGTMVLAGYWSAYWHNGRIYAPEIVRGLDVFKLTPSEYLSAAEIAAAEMITVGQANPQTQYRYEWPDNATVAQAYLDQLVRQEAVDTKLASRASDELNRWDIGRARPEQLQIVAAGFEKAAETADHSDAALMMDLAGVLRAAQ